MIQRVVNRMTRSFQTHATCLSFLSRKGKNFRGAIRAQINNCIHPTRQAAGHSAVAFVEGQRYLFFKENIGIWIEFDQNGKAGRVIYWRYNESWIGPWAVDFTDYEIGSLLEANTGAGTIKKWILKGMGKAEELGSWYYFGKTHNGEVIGTLQKDFGFKWWGATLEGGKYLIAWNYQLKDSEKDNDMDVLEVITQEYADQLLKSQKEAEIKKAKKLDGF